MSLNSYTDIVPTVVHKNYEWDATKASTNKQKHCVDFEEAISALEDPHGLIFEDTFYDDRTITLGYSNQARLLYIITTERRERTRIISARKATSHEQKLYHQGNV